MLGSWHRGCSLRHCWNDTCFENAPICPRSLPITRRGAKVQPQSQPGVFARCGWFPAHAGLAPSQQPEITKYRHATGSVLPPGATWASSTRCPHPRGFDAGGSLCTSHCRQVTHSGEPGWGGDLPAGHGTAEQNSGGSRLRGGGGGLFPYPALGRPAPYTPHHGGKSGHVPHTPHRRGLPSYPTPEWGVRPCPHTLYQGVGALPPIPHTMVGWGARAPSFLPYPGGGGEGNPILPLVLPVPN